MPERKVSETPFQKLISDWQKLWKAILRELLGHEGVKVGLGHHTGHKTHRAIVSLVCEVITSKGLLSYRWSHKLREKRAERTSISITLHGVLKIQGRLSMYTRTIKDKWHWLLKNKPPEVQTQCGHNLLCLTLVQASRNNPSVSKTGEDWLPTQREAVGGDTLTERMTYSTSSGHITSSMAQHTWHLLLRKHHSLTRTEVFFPSIMPAEVHLLHLAASVGNTCRNAAPPSLWQVRFGQWVFVMHK